jgi:hypothetical protein
MFGSINRKVEMLTSWDNDQDTIMNIGIDPAQTIASEAVRSLTEAQNEALIRSPSRGELKWRRMDPTLDAAVAPLLQKPIVPFHKTEKGKAHKSAIYYSECFLKGITPNDADRAALDIDSHYKKWWVQSAYHEQEGAGAPPRATLGSKFNEKPVMAGGISTDSSKRKYVQVVSDSSHYSHSEDNAKRRRRRGRLRDVIDDVAFDLQQEQGREEQIPEEAENSTGLTAARIIPEEEDAADPFMIQIIPNLSSVTVMQIEAIRDEILDTLRRNGGVLEDPTLKTGLSILESYYLSSDFDARRADTAEFPYDINGTWLTLSRPTYTECQGKNQSDEFLYSMGRMSFDMFRPTNLKCSIQGIFNTVQMLDAAKGELPFSMPRRIRKELGKSLVEGGVKGLRTYK